MSKLEQLLNKDKWQEYLEHKLNQSNLTRIEEENLKSFIENEKYLSISKKIIEGTYKFSIPKKILINKSGTTKKRVVYSFCYEENIILKFITFLISDYDYIFSKNLFSFRKKHTVKRAFYYLINHKNIKNMYAFKLDISNYFNSINIEKLLPKLEVIFKEDNKLFELLKDILILDKANFENQIIDEKRGVMAGTSISTFLANVYLMDLDKYFYDNKIIYARYSDDIIFFAKSQEEIDKYKNYIYSIFEEKNLTINKEKEFLFLPNSCWNFLGFEYNNGVVDLSDITLKKIKAKIRRKARSIYRWRIRKNLKEDKAIKAMIRVFNNKFYRESNTKDLTWCKWFFPVITTHKKLEEIDNYFVQYLRYFYTGKFTKKNYIIKYQTLKNLGFRSLVNEYYKFKNKNDESI